MARPKSLPPLEVLEKYLKYIPETGDLIWRERDPSTYAGARFNSYLAGKVAGTKRRNGYLQVVIEHKAYLAHRVAWKLHYREDPLIDIDHANLDRIDNRIENLRCATKSQNQANRSRLRTRKHPLPKGVMPNKYGFEARITVNRQVRRLGYFNCPAKAGEAYGRAAVAVWGEFARVGD